MGRPSSSESASSSPALSSALFSGNVRSSSASSFSAASHPPDSPVRSSTPSHPSLPSPHLPSRYNVALDIHTQAQTPTRLHEQFRRFNRSRPQDHIAPLAPLPPLSYNALSSSVSSSLLPMGSSRTWAPRSHPWRWASTSQHPLTVRHMDSGSMSTTGLHEYLDYLRSLRAVQSQNSAIVANFQSLSQELSLVLQEKAFLLQAQQSVRQQAGLPPLSAAELDQRLEASLVGREDKSQFAAKAKQLEIDIHKVPLAALEQSLNTDLNAGLTHDEIQRRQLSVGLNILTPPPSPMMVFLFIKELFSGFGPILWMAALLCFLAWRPFGSPADPVNLGLGIIIIVVILLSSSFAFYQTRKTISILSAFSRIIPSFAMVRRHGRDQQVLAADLVPGDIVSLRMGDKVPADIRLLSSDGLHVNNSALTGESEPVECTVESSNDNILESTNVCFYSSLVLQGAGIGVVINTGDRTVLGQVSALTKTDAGQRTNLQQEIRRFVLIICSLAITTAIVCFIAWISWLRVSHSTFLPTSAFLSNVIGLVVAYLPTGLPVSLSLVLTIVAKRMFQQKILVKNLSIVEDFNSVSMILSDKTGTLTINTLTATMALWGKIGKISIPLSVDTDDPFLHSGEFLHPVFQSMLINSILCNNAEVHTADPFVALCGPQEIIGDAIDVALYQLGHKCGVDIDTQRTKHARVKVMPFNSKVKMMSTINRSDTEDPALLLALCKGAPEFILYRCNRWMDDEGAEQKMTDEDRKAITERQEEMGANGYRVIAIAQQHITVSAREAADGANVSVPYSDYVFLGLFAFIDPPRPGVPTAVLKAHRAGIHVAMVTGDHRSTALAVAKQVNIINPDQPMDRCNVRTDALGWTVDITRDGRSLATHTIGLDGLDGATQPIPAPPQPLRSLFDDSSSSGEELLGKSVSDSSDPLPSPGSLLDEDTLTSKCGILVTGSDLKCFDLCLWNFVLRHSCLVFARTSPEQKLKIVSECQKRGEIVAVTGDGTNDAPALKRADVGVAMAAGAEVAQEASDMLLLDNNFASVVTAIEMGRLVSDNLKKVTLYLLPAGSWSELLPIIANFFLGLPLPLSAFLMIVICMLTDMTPSLALVNETAEKDIMKRKPMIRHSAHLVNWRLLFHAYALIGMIESFSAFLCWFWYFESQGLPASALFLAYDSYTDGYHGFSQAQLDEMMYTGQSIFFVSLVITQFANLLSTRTRYLSFFDHNPVFGPSRNPWLFSAMIVSSAIAIVITQVGVFNELFHTRPVPVKFVMPALGFGAFLFLFDEGRKRFIQRYPHSALAKLAW